MVKILEMIDVVWLSCCCCWINLINSCCCVSNSWRCRSNPSLSSTNPLRCLSNSSCWILMSRSNWSRLRCKSRLNKSCWILIDSSCCVCSTWLLVFSCSNWALIWSSRVAWSWTFSWATRALCSLSWFCCSFNSACFSLSSKSWSRCWNSASVEVMVLDVLDVVAVDMMMLKGSAGGNGQSWISILKSIISLMWCYLL